MAIEYPKLEDGDELRPQHRGFRLACCDCGLVHRINFRVKDGQVHLKLWREKRATAGVRRGMRRKGEGIFNGKG